MSFCILEAKSFECLSVFNDFSQNYWKPLSFHFFRTSSNYLQTFLMFFQVSNYFEGPGQGCGLGAEARSQEAPLTQTFKIVGKS